MSVVDGTLCFDQMLSKQLQSFSEITEALTLRMLELEERLEVLEESRALHEKSTNDATKLLLNESEERVKHLQDLLDLVKRTETSGLTDECNQSSQEPPSLGEKISDSTNEDQLLDNSSRTSKTFTNQKEGVEVNLELVETQYVDDPQMPLLSA